MSELNSKSPCTCEHSLDGKHSIKCPISFAEEITAYRQQYSTDTTIKIDIKQNCVRVTSTALVLPPHGKDGSGTVKTFTETYIRRAYYNSSVNDLPLDSWEAIDLPSGIHFCNNDKQWHENGGKCPINNK